MRRLLFPMAIILLFLLGKVSTAQNSHNPLHNKTAIATFENQSPDKEQFKTEVVIAAGCIICIGIILLGIMYVNQKKEEQKHINENLVLTQKLREIEDKLLNERIAQQEKIEETVLAQRKKISSDMHDNINSGLSALRYYISDLKKRTDEIKVRRLLENIEEETISLYKQSRDFSRSLTETTPAINYNVISLLNNLNKNFNEKFLMKVVTATDEATINKYFTRQQHYELYLVIKEAVANVFKHAKASTVIISIGLTGNIFNFSIVDNGKSPGQLKEETGQGICNMKDRIARLAGTIKFQFDEKGTSISGYFPLAHLNAANEILIFKNAG